MKKLRSLLLMLCLTLLAGNAFAEPEAEEAYRKAVAMMDEGKYTEAYTAFSALGTYEDSVDKAYLLRATTHAEELKSVGKGIVAFRFHGKWGFVNLSANALLEPLYDEIEPFMDNGLTRVKKDERVGLVDESGYTLTPCQWAVVSDFTGDVCTVAVTRNNEPYYGVLNRKSPASAEAKWTVIGDSKDFTIAPPAFTEGRMLCRDENGSWGYLDTEGRVVVRAQYSEAQTFSEGYAAVKTVLGLWQYIGLNGEVKIPARYTEACAFENGTADVRTREGDWQVIGKDGEKLFFLRIQNYAPAVELMAQGKYMEAYDLFAGLPGYKEADALAAECLLAQKYEDADMLARNGDRAGALKLFTELGEYKDSPARIEALFEADYKDAAALFDAGEYIKAAEAFAELGEYKDSAERVTACREAAFEKDYQAACALFEAGEYMKAAEAFAELGAYKDSAERVTACKEAVYRQAVDLMNAGKTKEAAERFAEISGYKDADAQRKKAEGLLQDPDKIFEIVVFGSYEQDNNTKNGKEPIEWYVLDRDGDKVLLLSKYALDVQPYHNKDKKVNWEKCSLRMWLNKEFLKTAFDSSEQKNIISQITTKMTEDRVFLLNASETEKFFGPIAYANVLVRAEPTEYALSKGAWIMKNYDSSKLTSGSTVNGMPATDWWIRGSYDMENTAAPLITTTGYLSTKTKVTRTTSTVRPAMWVTLPQQ